MTPASVRTRSALIAALVAALALGVSLAVPPAALGSAPSAPAPAGDVDRVVVDVVVDPDGTRHTRYLRTYGGLEVVGGDYVVHDDAAGPTTSTGRRDLALARLGDPDRVALSADQAEARAERSSARGSVLEEPEQVVWAVGAEPALAWRTEVVTPVPGGAHRAAVVVDADTGEVLAEYDVTMPAEGIGRGYQSGRVRLGTTRVKGSYQLIDPRHGDAETRVFHDDRTRRLRDKDNRWGDGTRRSAQSLATDVHYGMAATMTLLKKVLGRDGLAGDGVGPRAVAIHDERYAQAYWDPEDRVAVFGDGDPRQGVAPLTSLDVVGHELGHGVTTSTANLLYDGESGGLNEATSDIFGHAVEQRANNPQDAADYYVGEKVMSSGFLRRMDRPAADGSSFSCYRNDLGGYDVHRTSGIANHFYYLLAEGTGRKTIGGLPHRGESCVPGRVEGIGSRAALRIWYRALTVYMTTTTGYAEARDATVVAAKDLFGPESQACASVERAWRAVAVPAGFETCAIAPQEVLVNGGFEDGPEGWSGDTGAVRQDGAAARNGTGYASLGAVGQRAVLSTTVTLPRQQRLQASWHLHVRTEEEGQAYDWLTVTVIDEAGERHRLSRTSNHASDTTDPWQRFDRDLSGFRGQTVTLEFLATNDEARETRFVIDDVALAARPAADGPSELIPGEFLVDVDEAPHAGTLGWTDAENDVTLDPDAEDETFFAEAQFWCKSTWYGPLGVRTFRHRNLYVSSPRDAETTLEQDVAVFANAGDARAAYETLRSSFGSADCLDEVDPEEIERQEGAGSASSTWYLQLPPDRDVPLSQTVSLVQRGRALSVLLVGTDQDRLAWQPAWLLPTAAAALEKLADYE